MVLTFAVIDVCPPAENCTQGCQLEKNQSVCFCKNGFILNEDNKTCIGKIFGGIPLNVLFKHLNSTRADGTFYNLIGA